MMSTLSADRPQAVPSQDLFGYAPFAQTLTDAICRYRDRDALVLGLHGAWGSGKSTVLKFICHNLEQMEEDTRPIVIEFNPWWFSGQENLAKAFLGQLQAVLPTKLKAFKKLGKLLADFSEGLGSMLDVTGMTGGIGEKTGRTIKKVVQSSPQDVPSLKKKICAVLQKSTQRILIIVDDIDRLDADEIRQLFTVIKALADFPQVIYLLAFDQHVVVRALEQHSGMPGQAYLEKIIQASFTMPLLDRSALHKFLLTRLDDILQETPDPLLDQAVFRKIFYNGLEYLFSVPRDIVRFCNTLSVTYPAVCGEVNAFDFIAIESIRIFLPDIYIYIRENQDKFIGNSFQRGILSKEKLEDILKKYDRGRWNEAVEKVLKLIFPSLKASKYVSPTHSDRRKLRICVDEFFPRYFCFSLPEGAISRADMLQWLDKANDADAFAAVLHHAKEQGTAQVRKLLDRLRDHVADDIQAEDIPTLLDLFLDMGDDLLELPEERIYHLFSTIDVVLTENIELLLKRLPLEHRLPVLEKSMRKGKAIVAQSFLLGGLESEQERWLDAPVPQNEMPRFTALWCEKIEERIRANSLANHPYLAYLLAAWRHREPNSEKITSWCAKAVQTNEGLLAFVQKFLETRASYSAGDMELSRFMGLSILEHYINIADCTERLQALQEVGNIPPEYAETVSFYMQAVAASRKADVQ